VLPAFFTARDLVVAEKVDLVSKIDTVKRYARIGREQTRELAFGRLEDGDEVDVGRGDFAVGEEDTSALSSAVLGEGQVRGRRVDGKIAFIDTERWHHDKDLLRKVGDRLSGDRRKQAEAVFKELRGKGAKPFTSMFK